MGATRTLLIRDYLCRASQRALLALDAVGVEIAAGLATGFIGRQLHGTHAGAQLTGGLAGTADMDCLEAGWQWLLLGGHPTRDGAHGTEAAPCAGCIDEREDDTDDGGQEDDGPEHATDIVPHIESASAPTHLTELDAKHGEDEEHHEEAEARSTYKAGDGFVGGIFGEKTVVEVATRTDVAAPEAATPDGGDHRTYHADECNEADGRKEPRHNEICDDDPIERQAGCSEVPMKVFLLLFHNVSLMLF